VIVVSNCLLHHILRMLLATIQSHIAKHRSNAAKQVRLRETCLFCGCKGTAFSWYREIYANLFNLC